MYLYMGTFGHHPLRGWAATLAPTLVEFSPLQVMGGLSFTPAEMSFRGGADSSNDSGVDQALLGLKVTRPCRK